MLPAVFATSSSSGASPLEAVLTALIALGQVVFSAPSEISFQVLFAPFSVWKDALLIWKSHFLRKCAGPEESFRTILVIGVAGLQWPLLARHR